MTRRTLTILGGVLSTAAVLVPATAGAATRRSTLRLAGTSSTQARAAGASSTAPNTDLAGYLGSERLSSSVATRFRVPKLKCNAQDTGIAPGVSAFSGSPDRLFFSSAGIILGCTNGTQDASHEALVVNDTEKDYAKRLVAGDLLKLKVTVSSSQTVAQLSDLTKGHAFQLTVTGKGYPADEELIGEDAVVLASSKSQTPLPVPNFGTIGFGSAEIGGSPLGSRKLQGFNMTTSSGKTEIATGAITGSPAEQFKSVWKS